MTNDDQIGSDAPAPEFRDGMPFLGGGLWLDLLNTVVEADGRRLDLIADGARLADWARSAGLTHGPAEAEAAAARALREALRPAFVAMAAGDGVPASAVAAANDELARIHVRRHLAATGHGLALVEEESVEGPRVAAAAAADFARFVQAFEPARLKSCAAPTCRLVFYDRGKNNRRRWCSMAVCGNREKVANYRARHGAPLSVRLTPPRGSPPSPRDRSDSGARGRVRP